MWLCDAICDVMWCHMWIMWDHVMPCVRSCDYVMSCDAICGIMWDHVMPCVRSCDWCHMWDHVMSCDVCHHMTSQQHLMSVLFDVPFFSHRVTYPMKMSCFWTMESRYIEWCGYNNITIVQSYTGSLLPSVLLWLCNTSNNANDNKLVIFLSLVVMILSYEPMVLLHVQT